MVRLLKSRFGSQYLAIVERLGWPPDFSKLDAEFWATEQGLLLATLRPEIEAMVQQSIAMTSTTVPILWDEPVIAGDAVQWAHDYSYRLVTDLTANTRKFLQRKIPQFLETPGMTVGDLRAQLAPVFGESRARMIATTEVTRAFSHGTIEVQKRLATGGVRMHRIWRTSMDERVCPLCGPLEGKPEIEWNGVDSDAPPAHVNCRCWATLTVAER